MLHSHNIIYALFGTVLPILSTSCFADMTLDASSSKLSIFSTEKSDKKKTHPSPKLSGSLSHTGDLKVTLDLNSINTTIPLPEIYLNKGLLAAGKNSKATLSAKITDDLSTNGIKMIKTDATLEVYGLRQTVSFDVTVVRTGDKLIAASTKPALISAPKLNLGSGFPAVALTIPVSFVLVFNDDKAKPADKAALDSTKITQP